MKNVSNYILDAKNGCLIFCLYHILKGRRKRHEEPLAAREGSEAPGRLFNVALKRF